MRILIQGYTITSSFLTLDAIHPSVLGVRERYVGGYANSPEGKLEAMLIQV